MIRWVALAACACLAAYLLARGNRSSWRASAVRRLAAGGAAADTGARSGTGGRLLRRVRERFEESRLATGAMEALSLSGIDLSWNAFLLLWAWSLLFVPALALVVSGSILAAPPALIVALILPPRVLGALKGRAARKLDRQAESFARDLSLYLRCGVPVEDAVVLCGEDATPPLSSRLEEPLGLIALGSPEEALESLARILEGADIKLIVNAVMTSRQTGSDVRVIMGALGESLRDRSAIRRELSTQTVQARLSGKVVAALPLLFLGLSAVVSRKSLSVLFGTVPGIVMLSVAAVLELAGFLWIRKILDIEV